MTNAYIVSAETLTWAAWGFIGMCLGVVVGLNLRGHLESRRSQRIEVRDWGFGPERDEIRILGPEDDAHPHSPRMEDQ